MVKWNWGKKSNAKKSTKQQLSVEPLPNTVIHEGSLIELLKDWRKEGLYPTSTTVPGATTNFDRKAPTNNSVKYQTNDPKQKRKPPMSEEKLHLELDHVLEFTEFEKDCSIEAAPELQRTLSANLTTKETKGPNAYEEFTNFNPYEELENNEQLSSINTTDNNFNSDKQTRMEDSPLELKTAAIPTIDRVQETQGPFNRCSFNTTKYKQIIECLDEYAAELRSILEDEKSFDETFSINKQHYCKSFTETPQNTPVSNHDNESILSRSTICSNITMSIGTADETTPHTDISDTPGSYMSSLSEFDKPHKPTQKTQHLSEKKPIELHIKIHDPKDELIKDLGLPRNKRGSVVSDPLLLDEHNDYNLLIGKESSSKKPSKALNFYIKDCTGPNSPNIFSPIKSQFAEDDTTKNSLTCNLKSKASVNKSSPLRNHTELSDSYQKSKKAPPNLSLNTTINNQSSGRYVIRVKEKEKTKAKEDGSHQRTESSSTTMTYTPLTACSSVRTTRTLKSPASIIQNSATKDRMKANRTSSVYVSQSGSHFRNIDMSANPLPLFNNFSQNYNHPENPYAEDNPANSYVTVSDYNPYGGEAHVNPYVSHSVNPY